MPIPLGTVCVGWTAPGRTHQRDPGWNRDWFLFPISLTDDAPLQTSKARACARDHRSVSELSLNPTTLHSTRCLSMESSQAPCPKNQRSKIHSHTLAQNNPRLISGLQWTGTALSIVAFIGMVFLVWAEYTEFATITPESRLICKITKRGFGAPASYAMCPHGQISCQCLDREGAGKLVLFFWCEMLALPSVP